MSLMQLSLTTPIVAYSAIVPAVRIDREITSTTFRSDYQNFNEAWQGGFDEELELTKHKEKFMQKLFQVTFGKTGESVEDLNPLDRILHIGALEANEAIRKALTKKDSYLRRLFTTENWEEWTEKRTSLGKVVGVFEDYLEGSKLDHLLVKRLDRQTIHKANAEAALLLQQFDRVEGTSTTEVKDLKGKVTENPASCDKPIAASSFFNTISSSFWSVAKSIQASLISIDRQLSFPVATAKKVEIKTLLDALQDAQKFAELKETIDKIVQNKPVEKEDTWWDTFKSIKDVAKDPTSWYEELVQGELVEIVTQRLYELNEKYIAYNEQIDKFLRIRQLQNAINQMGSIMGEISQDMKDQYNKIAVLETAMEQLLKKLKKASDEGGSVERLRDEARERYRADVARMGQIDEEITRQYHAAIAATQALGIVLPSSMWNRDDYAAPFTAEVQQIYDRVMRDENLIKMHFANMEKYSAEIRELKKEYGEHSGKHAALVQTYNKLEQLLAQGKEQIEGWKKEKEEL